MARYRGPEEFFEAFRQAARPEAKLPPRPKATQQALTPPQRPAPASPSRPVAPAPQPLRRDEEPDEDNLVRMRHSTLGVAVVILGLLMALSYLVGRGSRSVAETDPRVALGEPRLAPPLEMKRVGPAQGAPASPERPASPPVRPADGPPPVSPPPAPPAIDQTRYELRLITYPSSAAMRDRATALVKYLNGLSGLRDENVTAVVQQAGTTKLVVSLVPFESCSDARASRLLKFVQTAKYEGQVPFSGALFYKVER